MEGRHVRARLALVATGMLLAAPVVSQAACVAPRTDARTNAAILRALHSGRDLWGVSLLARKGGPTYASAASRLAPLLFARTSKGRPLTASGVYYLPFAEPEGARGAGSVDLHVADGSQILAQNADGPSLTVRVSGERFGACLRQLVPATLADGWLPVMRTGHRGYRQESFAARIPETRSLVSFVRVTGAGPISFVLSARGLRRDGNRLVSGSTTYAVFGTGGRWDRRTLTFRSGVALVAWLGRPGAVRPFQLDEGRYAEERAGVGEYWRTRLAEGASFEVPDAHVMHAERSLIVQNLGLTWRYSTGNPYREFSFPESLDNAQVMAELGFPAVSRSIIRTSFTRRPTGYPNWSLGEKLLAAATYMGLYRDRAFLAQATPVLAGYVDALAGRVRPDGLLEAERFSSDIHEPVLGLHAQAVAWQGLRGMATAWAEAGNARLAARARAVAEPLGRALRRAVLASETTLPDGALFIPMRLLAGEKPYRSVTESREGSYWNLVAPYAFASGLFPAGGREASGALTYLSLHGSWLLGLVRAGAFSLYGHGPTKGGTDEVYGLNLARFLAREHRPDLLALALYGQLGAAMTPNTFVSGEAASVAPLDGQRFRSMYLPPNSTSNGAFLETLLLMLVQEDQQGLSLAPATLARWLRAGSEVAVSHVPTRFGELSFRLSASARAIRVHVDVPSRMGRKTLRLSLRLPDGRRVRSVVPSVPFDPSSGTLDLSGHRGSLDFRVRTS